MLSKIEFSRAIVMRTHNIRGSGNEPKVDKNCD